MNVQCKVKYLQDDLGRIVGTCPFNWATNANVEYGTRDREGILHVAGIAKVRTKTQVKKDIDSITEYKHYK